MGAALSPLQLMVVFTPAASQPMFPHPVRRWGPWTWASGEGVRSSRGWGSVGAGGVESLLPGAAVCPAQRQAL